MTYDNAKKEFVKLINSISGGKYSPSQVFSDFVTMAAIGISNSVNFNQKREDTYMELIRKYDPNEQKEFSKLLALVADGLNAKYGDFLGECYMGLDFGNASTGQFFTPYCVSKMCAAVTFDKQLTNKMIAEKGYIGLHEPTCGSGGMIVAFLEVLRENGYNFQTQSLTIAQDIDYRCAYMCYIHLSLLGAPAIVSIGNTLMLEVWDELHTPFYVFNYSKFMNKPKIEKGTSESLALETPKNTVTDAKEPEPVQTPKPVIKAPTTAKKQQQLSFF